MNNAKLIVAAILFGPAIGFARPIDSPPNSSRPIPHVMPRPHGSAGNGHPIIERARLTLPEEVARKVAVAHCLEGTRWSRTAGWTSGGRFQSGGCLFRRQSR